jgi:O-methyltransferase involved in polyketide biosynthesis
MVDFIAIIGILYDLDFPEVIEIKKKLLPENECYTDFLIS